MDAAFEALIDIVSYVNLPSPGCRDFSLLKTIVFIIIFMCLVPGREGGDGGRRRGGLPRLRVPGRGRGLR